jgi:hypothetical protein
MPDSPISHGETRSRIDAEHEEKLAAEDAVRKALGRTWVTSPAIGSELALGRPCTVCYAVSGEKCRFVSGDPCFSFHRARSGAGLDESPVSATADTEPAGGSREACAICRALVDMPGTTAVCAHHGARRTEPVPAPEPAKAAKVAKPERPKLPKDFWLRAAAASTPCDHCGEPFSAHQYITTDRDGPLHECVMRKKPAMKKKTKRVTKRTGAAMSVQLVAQAIEIFEGSILRLMERADVLERDREARRMAQEMETERRRYEREVESEERREKRYGK